MPRRITNSQVLGIRTWTSLGVEDDSAYHSYRLFQCHLLDYFVIFAEVRCLYVCLYVYKSISGLYSVPLICISVLCKYYTLLISTGLQKSWTRYCKFSNFVLFFQKIFDSSRTFIFPINFRGKSSISMKCLLGFFNSFIEVQFAYQKICSL